MRMISSSFMAIGFVIIIAFIDDKKRVLVSLARCDACMIMFMDDIIPLVPTSAITLSMGA